MPPPEHHNIFSIFPNRTRTTRFRWVKFSPQSVWSPFHRRRNFHSPFSQRLLPPLPPQNLHPLILHRDRQMELNLGIHPGNQKLIGRELAHENAAGVIFSAGRLMSSIELGKPESNRGLPVPEVKLAFCLTRFFHGGFELALETQLRNHILHGRNQRVIFAMQRRPSPSLKVHPVRSMPKGNKTDCLLPQRVEEIMPVHIVHAGFRDP